MNKAYLIRVTKSIVADVWVCAESEKNAIDNVKTNVQCIGYEDFEPEFEPSTIECCDVQKLTDLEPGQSIYDSDLGKSRVDLLLEEKGGEE